MHLNETWWMTEFLQWQSSSHNILYDTVAQRQWCMPEPTAAEEKRRDQTWLRDSWGERIKLGPQSSQARSPSCFVWVIGHCVWINHFRYSISGWQQCFITCTLAGTHIRFKIHILLSFLLFLSLTLFFLYKPSLSCFCDPIFSLLLEIIPFHCFSYFPVFSFSLKHNYFFLLLLTNFFLFPVSQPSLSHLYHLIWYRSFAVFILSYSFSPF